MSTGLSPVRVGLADQVVDLLIQAIARGDYPPDSQLPPEADIAERCQVSRLTLREAIKSLRAKGVVRVEQGRGTFVNPRSQWSALDPALLSARLADPAGTGDLARQLTEARRIVEVGVAELAAERRSDADLAMLEAALERMRQAHEADDANEFTTADIDFHDAIIQAAGNEVLGALFEPIEALVRMVRFETSTVVETRANGLALHAAVAAAVRSGSPEAARQAMLQHFSHTELTLQHAMHHMLTEPTPNGTGRSRRKR